MVSAKAFASDASESRHQDGPPARRRLPLIAIAGSAGKSTVAWMLNDILSEAGHNTAAWLSSGVYIGDIRFTNEIHAWERAILAARAREIDYLIQELSAPLTLGIGLRPRSYQVGLVTTICGSDDRCQRIPDTRREIEAVIRLMDAIADDGIAIGNADDVLVVEQLERTGAESILFALNRRNPALHNHLQGGGSGTWLDHDWIVAGTLDDQRRIVRVSELRAAYGGAFVFQVQNALAAVSSAVALGIDRKVIASALSSFMADGVRLPGRCNISTNNGIVTVIDSPHLILSVRGLCRGVRSIGARRTVAVVDGSVEIDQEQLVEAGRVIGSIAGVVVLCGDDESHVLREIRQGLAIADKPPVILVFSDRTSAYEYLSDSLQVGDAAAVFTGEPSAALSHFTMSISEAVGD